MFFHPTTMKWILWISLGKIAILTIWGVLVHTTYALLGTMIISCEWILAVISDLLK